jgi:hypothetical protein
MAMRPKIGLALVAAFATTFLFASQSLAEPPPAAASSAAPGGSASRSLQGFWQGAIEVGALKLRIWARVTQAADGSYTATMDSPDQGAKDLPVSAVTVHGDSVRFELKNLGAAFDGRLDATASTLTGNWHQGGQSLPLVLARSEEQHVAARPQEPKKPYPYDEEEVTYASDAPGVQLAGTLTLPRSKMPCTAVLLITGSGPQDRDEALLGHRPFLVLADYLTRRGIAVLRVDDRGTGKSTGKFATATSRDFARDARGGVAYLRGRKEIDPKRIGLLGHSEGGLIAPMVAAQSRDIAFIVLLAGPGLTGDEILLRQGALIAKAMGASDSTVARSRAVQERTYAVLKSEPDSATAQKKIHAIQAEAFAKLTEAEKNSMHMSESMIDQQIKAVMSPWFRYFLTYDPRPTLQQVKCPVLAIDGDLDLQVPPKEDLDAIAAALKKGGNKDYKTVQLPKLNHLFQTCKTGSPSEYGTIDETIAPVALDTIGDWIVSHAER